GHGERRRMGELVVGADDEVLKRISRVEGPGVGALLVEPPGSAGGRAQSIRVRRSRPTVTVPIAGNGRIATETTGGGAVADLQRYIDQPAGRQAKALGDEIQVVVMDPDRREVIGHTKRDRILGRFEANDGFKPHLEDVLGEEPLEVTFNGFPQAGRESQRRHGASEARSLFTPTPLTALSRV